MDIGCTKRFLVKIDRRIGIAADQMRGDRTHSVGNRFYFARHARFSNAQPDRIQLGIERLAALVHAMCPRPETDPFVLVAS